MADIVLDLASEDSRRDEVKAKGIASAMKEVVDLLDDDDDDDEKTQSCHEGDILYSSSLSKFCCPSGWLSRKFKGCTTMYLGAPAILLDRCHRQNQLSNEMYRY